MVCILEIKASSRMSKMIFFCRSAEALHVNIAATLFRSKVASKKVKSTQTDQTTTQHVP